ncbi:MAG: hypothetical protein U0411_00535 [Thermodesulfovibrionales bacterium]
MDRLVEGFLERLKRRKKGRGATAEDVEAALLGSEAKGVHNEELIGQGADPRS